nr:MAG TPA: hypothetical protein [Caudoviricetes sp.]
MESQRVPARRNCRVMKCDGIANHRSAKQRLSAAKKSNGIARRRIEWPSNGWAARGPAPSCNGVGLLRLATN